LALSGPSDIGAAIVTGILVVAELGVFGFG